MSAWSKKATFCRFLDQVVNNGVYEIVDQVFHPDFVGISPEQDDPILGPAGASEWAHALRTGFPDINTLIEGGWLIAEDDGHHVGKGVVAERVAALVVLRGTHLGGYSGIAPTGRRINWSQVHLLRFESGLIVEDQIITDRLAILQQMDVVHTPDGVAAARVPAELI
jgi:hypothetical protein